MATALRLAARPRLERLVKFGAVGMAGLGVNLVVQAALTEGLGMNYVAAAILATQVSSTVNFVVADRWVFEDGATTSRPARYLAFLAMNNAALLLRVPIMWVLTTGLGVFYSVSNLVSLAVLTLVRFLLADGLIWRMPTVEPIHVPQHADAAAAEAVDVSAVGVAATSSVVTPRPLHAGERPAPRHADADADADAATILPFDRPGSSSDPPGDNEPGRAGLRSHPERWLLAGFVAVGTVLRVWQIGAVGLNSDEAVYAGQAAAIAGNHDLEQYFPVFRAHPMLFQGLLSLGYHFGTSELAGRLLAAAFGVGTIVLAYLVAKLLYGTRAGVLAALIVALMPYQVIVDREILLDAPTAFFATLTLYLLARYAMQQRLGWLMAAAGAAGLTVLAKETSIVLLVAIFAFLALSPEIRVRFRDAVISLAVFVTVLLPFPLIIVLAGKSTTGTSYLSWQLFRRPNHPFGFYATTLPWYIGPVVVVLAGVGLLIRWRTQSWSWREWLLLSWSFVPFVFFQLWPVKGFHYLLAAAVPVALLGAAGLDEVVGLLARVRGPASRRVGIGLGWLAAGAVGMSLIIPAWTNTQTQPSSSLLAGAGGVPGGREAGTWIGEHAPEGAEIITVGPSMANLVQFYGGRKAYGLSVSPNAVDRNPSYEPLRNPDLALRTGQVQYIVWDAYSSSRSSFFSNRLSTYVQRYHGRPVFAYESEGQDLVTVYEVRP